MQTQTTQEARWEAARERATERNVRLQVVESRRRYMTASQSTDDTVYTVTASGRLMACDCPGYQFTGVCKHVAALQLRAEREGWGNPPSTTEARGLAVSLLRGPR